MDGKKRNLENKILQLLESFPCVVILGVRQCGKSTLVKNKFPDWHYFDLENINHFTRIDDDPILFFNEYPEKVIIDEAQQSPKLFSCLRGIIDADRNKKGRFILTGSASFNLIQNISESLAGRVGIIELSTFKMNEFLEKPLPPFYKIFESKISNLTKEYLKQLKPDKDIKTIKRFLLKGGYPEPVLSKNDTFFKDWMQNYFQTYITRDLRAIHPKLDFIKYRRVVLMLSSLSGTIINKTDISRSIESSEKTVRDYVDIINGTYFWRSLPAFASSKIKTTIKLPKGHFRDCGLAFYLQNIYTNKDLENFSRLGSFFENFIVEEIIKGIDAVNAYNVDLFHFRTKAGGEIDLLLQGSFGLLPIEIKYNSITPKKKLSSMINFIDKYDLPLGIVVNNSTEIQMITDKIIQIPVGVI